MPIDKKKTRLIFRRVSRELNQLARKPAAGAIHKFRTNSRRVEALLSEVVPKLNRNDKKLLKLLASLRKKAGRVRDLDVQIGLLRNLKIPGGNGRRAQFLEALVEERRRREEKLAKGFDAKTVGEIRRRLKRAVAEMHLSPETEPLALTLRQLNQLARDHTPLTERTLHRYRIVGKRARYIAELAAKDEQASRVVERLKHLQDIIGNWHDWLKLSQKAEEVFGGVRESSLVSMLHNVTRAKFRECVDAVAQTRAALSTPVPREAEGAAPGRKSAAKDNLQATAAVA
jgi:CHAD domain-containing protein